MLRIGQRTGRQRFAAFDAHHFAPARRHRQGEVADAAEQVEQTVARPGIQQLECARHQHAVDLVVDLREIGRLEGHGDAEFGQRVGQRTIQRIERIDRVRPFRLQPELHGVPVGERAQLRLVGRRERLEDTQHQRGHILADRHLDLRHALDDAQAADQFAQRHQQCGHVRREHLARSHIGHVAALALVEAHQHSALGRHMAHGQPRAIAIPPVRPGDGAEHHIGTELGQVPQVVFQHALLDGDLRTRIQMLHRAAAAGAEEPALRRHARGRLAQNIDQGGLLIGRLGPMAAVSHPLTRQCAFHEHHFAGRTILVGQTAHAARFVIERHNLQRPRHGHLGFPA